MAIFHLSAQMIKRSAGRSATAAAAYRAGERIVDQRTGVINDYSKRRGVEFTKIFAPANAPEFAQDRDKLWNSCEKHGPRKDSQTAREIEIALPRELTLEQNKALIEEFITTRLVPHGMVADLAIHNTAKNNPHAHILLTTRDLTDNGFGKVNLVWFSQKNSMLKETRLAWEVDCNRHLAMHGFDARIDHRSHKDRELDALPTIHHGGKPALKAKNNEIIRINKELAEAIQIRSQLRSSVPADEPAGISEDDLERFSAFADDLDAPQGPQIRSQPRSPVPADEPAEISENDLRRFEELADSSGLGLEDKPSQPGPKGPSL